MNRRNFVFAMTLPLVTACRREGAQRPRRCAFCGMRIPPGSHWEAGATAANGAALAFDTPGCLFRHRFSPAGNGQRNEWVTEYYGPSGRHTDARAVRYVIGSDVVGPMGPDLIPIEPARAEQFMRDHHGRENLGYERVDRGTLDRL